MSILSKKKTSTLWILLVQGGSYSYKVELTFTIDQFLKNKKASKYADCKSPGKESLLKYYGVKTERRVYVDSKIGMKSQLEG